MAIKPTDAVIYLDQEVKVEEVNDPNVIWGLVVTAPSFWRNLTKAAGARNITVASTVKEQINQLLLRYKGVYKPTSRGHGYIKFPSEKYKTLFLLRWS